MYRDQISIGLGWMIGSALLAGCLSQETIQRIEGTPGQEGTGIFLSRLPAVIKILATYEPTDQQRKIADERARRSLKTFQDESAKNSSVNVPTVIAVDTDADERSRGARSVMLWDTQTEEILGNEVYDVEEPPTLGNIALWNNVSARYVGRGM